MVSKRLSREAGHRRKFLAIIDETPECERAVAYASKRAQHTGGVPVLLFVIDPTEFQALLGVETGRREEATANAKSALDAAAGVGGFTGGAGGAADVGERAGET